MMPNKSLEALARGHERTATSTWRQFSAQLSAVSAAQDLPCKFFRLRLISYPFAMKNRAIKPVRAACVCLFIAACVMAQAGEARTNVLEVRRGTVIIDG